MVIIAAAHISDCFEIGIQACFFFFFRSRYSKSAELLLCTILRQKGLNSGARGEYFIISPSLNIKNVYFSNNKTNTELIFSSRGALRLTVA